MTSKSEIESWFKRGVAEGRARMIVWCDTYDYEDYPQFTDQTGDDLLYYVEKENGTNMKKVMEVYDLNANMDDQMQQRRAFNY